MRHPAALEHHLLDVVVNDVSLAVEKVLHNAFRLPEVAPARLPEQVVEAGYFGRKTGRGFRNYRWVVAAGPL